VPPGATTHNRAYEGGLGPEFQALLYRAHEREAAEARRGIRAWLLAPTPEIYRALMLGQDVPADELSLEAVLRYGLKKGAA
jgi:hypothetical protein